MRHYEYTNRRINADSYIRTFIRNQTTWTTYNILLPLLQLNQAQIF